MTTGLTRLAIGLINNASPQEERRGREMKPPKEPKAFRYPRLYAVEAYEEYRMRIVYPDGTGEWLKNLGWHISCWCYESSLSPRQYRKAMKEHDARYNFKRIFLGEIK